MWGAPAASPQQRRYTGLTAIKKMYVGEGQNGCARLGSRSAPIRSRPDVPPSLLQEFAIDPGSPPTVRAASSSCRPAGDLGVGASVRLPGRGRHLAVCLRSEPGRTLGGLPSPLPSPPASPKPTRSPWAALNRWVARRSKTALATDGKRLQGKAHYETVSLVPHQRHAPPVASTPKREERSSPLLEEVDEDALHTTRSPRHSHTCSRSRATRRKPSRLWRPSTGTGTRLPTSAKTEKAHGSEAPDSEPLRGLINYPEVRQVFRVQVKTGEKSHRSGLWHPRCPPNRPMPSGCWRSTDWVVENRNHRPRDTTFVPV